MTAAQHSVFLENEAQQEACGARLAAACDGPLLVFLQGDLGAGKTTFTRGLVRGFGHVGAVKSPTYTLIEPYDIAGRKVYHLDLYRVGDPGELEYLGLREMLAEEAVLVVEWPERGEGWLPTPDLWLRIDHRPDGRMLDFRAETERGVRILERLIGNLQ